MHIPREIRAAKYITRTEYRPNANKRTRGLEGPNFLFNLKPD